MQLTILTVDDDPMNLVILSEILEDLCTVVGVESGQEALEKIKNGLVPDLILLDVEMPELSGYDLIKLLKEHPVTQKTPIIFITGHDDIESEEFGLTLGAADYIRKPLNYAITRSRIIVHLENKRAKDILADHNSSLEKEICRRIYDNEIIQNVSLSALAMLAEVKDQETGNHILRTQKYVEMICKDLQANSEYATELTDEKITRIVKVAPLHDIGKIGIPDYILTKPGKFNAEELEIMHAHSEIGARALEKAIESVMNSELGKCNRGSFAHAVAFLEIGAQIARHHHERWDGTGYPGHLKGRDIPLPARIMAVADVFDALISERCYKKSYPIEDSIEIIRNGNGTHFDPIILESFERVRSLMVEIALQYKEIIKSGESKNDKTTGTNS